MTIYDEESKKKILPQVICEPSLGVERAFLVFMFDAYTFDQKRQNIVLKLHPRLAPIKAAIFPIIKKPVYEKIKKDYESQWKHLQNSLFIARNESELEKALEG